MVQAETVRPGGVRLQSQNKIGLLLLYRNMKCDAHVWKDVIILHLIVSKVAYENHIEEILDLFCTMAVL